MTAAKKKAAAKPAEGEVQVTLVGRSYGHAHGDKVTVPASVAARLRANGHALPEDDDAPETP